MTAMDVKTTTASTRSVKRGPAFDDPFYVDNFVTVFD